jgi:polysaccharide biosynthesis transport protein
VSKNFELLRQAGINADNGNALAAPRREILVPEPVPVNPLPRSREKSGAEWLRALEVLRKHWHLSALFAAAVICSVIVVTFSIKPVYAPVAQLEVDPPGETFSLDGGNQGYSDSEYLETQAKNLKSDSLAVNVIRRLHLDQNPAFVRSAEPRQTSATNPANYQLSPAENSALGAFRAHFTVKRDTSSRLIAVSFASTDPKLAALVTNTAVDTFIDDTYRDRHDAIMRSSAWLARQLDDIRTRMEESNRVLADYQKSIGVADVDDNKSTFTEEMGELNRQLTQAQADRIQLEALLRSVQAGSPDVLPEIRNNPVVQQLSTQLAQVRASLSQARVIYGVNHPKVKELQNQADELQSQLEGQKTAVLGSIRSSYAAAKAREQLMNSEIKGTSDQLSQMARYNALKREAQANSDLYNNLYARVKESGIAAASKTSNLRMADQARVLDSPSYPNRPLDIGLGILVALAGGIGLAFVREQFDTRLFTPEDVRDWIGTSNVAIVPLFFGSNGQPLPPGQSRSAVAAGASANGKLAPGVRFLLDRPHSPEAEALRSLYTSVMLSRPGNPPQVVLVVSSFPGEGKTTVAVNLAMAMAQHGTTCLVDADLRRGRVASAFGMSSEVGLSDVLIGTSTLEQAMVSVASVPNLNVIPAHAGSVQAGQLVCSDSMRNLLEELRQRFQFVVVDSAPILPFADGRALSNLADGLIFVGRSGMTTKDVVLRSLDLLREVHSAPVLEFVLNAADLNAPQYRYYQYAYDYYQPAAK